MNLSVQTILNSNTVRVIAIIAIIIAAFYIGYVYNKDSFENNAGTALKDQDPLVVAGEEEVPDKEVKGVTEETDSGAPVNLPFNKISPEISPVDLLPQNPPEVVAFNDSVSKEGNLNNQNFVVAGFNIGINTVGSSHKNANQQLRSDPYIPRVETGPWNQSTIQSSDLTNRRTLEIGN